MAGSSDAGEFASQIADGAAVGMDASGGTRHSDALTRLPELAAWVTKQLGEARSNQSHRAQSSIEYQGGTVSIRFETLTLQRQSVSRNDLSNRGASGEVHSARENRYAVIVSPIENSIPEGASVITRQQWHDIKNHLGGLKLYATFLKKKTADGGDQAIVEKMLNGINGLIDHLAQIRGGDAK